MQTALHIKSLVAELRHHLIGGKIISTEFYKKERAAYLFVKTGKGRLALGFVYHPHGAGVFLVPASKIRLETREKPWPFFELNAGTIDDVVQIGLDRILTIKISQGKKEILLVAEALGPNGNLWLLNSDNEVQASLRRRTFETGARYSPPKGLEGLSPLGMTADQLKELLGNHPETPAQFVIEKHVLGFNRTLASEAVHRAGVAREGLSGDDVVSLATTISDLADRFGEAGTGYYYTGGRIEVYPIKLAGWEEQPEKFKTLSLAVAAMCTRRQSQTEEVDERKTTIQMVKRAIKRLRTRLKKIDADIAEASDFDHYRRQGELLQISFDQLKRGMAEIAVKDVYVEGEPSVDITLNPALSPAENVEMYFRRYRKGREGLDIMKRRGEISTAELGALEEMFSDLENNYEAAFAQYEAELSALRPRTSERSDTVSPRLPFRSYTLSTGLTIYVGRDGSDNDRTTFEYARPWEIWMHVQQCPGSHVVIKAPNKSFEPSKREIEEAAAITAWFSKARNNSSVPVAYTLRKYVRKPRKAKPGLVMVEREKSIMVVPTKPNKDQ
ncbi:MAG: NFACT family protein [candidate division Zixibacteria bacterium]|nr:NFACT family protein [candidate division Zixibacteria bacterium]